MRARRDGVPGWARSVTTILLAAALIAPPASVRAVETMPPDFVHGDSPHLPRFSPEGGNRDRELLLIFVHFTDQESPTNRDLEWARNRFFRGNPGVVAYYREQSFGKLILTPAPETQGEIDDGVVEVNAGAYADFVGDGASPGREIAKGLQLADSFVDFAGFDDNEDGVVDNLELAVVVMRDGPGNCGAARSPGQDGWPADVNTFDGKTISLLAAATGILTNLMTQVHEVAHLLVDMVDFYGFPVGNYDVGIATCFDFEFLVGVHAYNKLHWGWISPQVVTHDDFYEIRNAETSGDAFILYDPRRGDRAPLDYFIIENRQRNFTGFDRGISDAGLVIHRITDDKLQAADPANPPIAIIKAAESDDDGDFAWDPTDPGTPQRSVELAWQDGSSAGLAVRAIGASSNVARAFLDIWGPGVLVDPSTPNGRPLRVTASPGEPKSISFPVMNTGESTDTFDFTIAGLPEGWTASTDTMILESGNERTATVELTPDPDADVSPNYNLDVVGRSTTNPDVDVSAPFSVTLELDRTRIAYTGPTSGPFGEPAPFEARVTNRDEPGEPPVEGVEVTFKLKRESREQIFTAVTDQDGIARTDSAIEVPPAFYSLEIRTPRFGKHAPGVTGASFTVLRRPSALVYIGDTTGEYSDPVTLSTVLTDGLNGQPLPGQTVDFSLGTQAGSAVTDTSGIASTQVTLDQGAGEISLDASFGGDSIYLPTTASGAFVVDKEDVVLAYTGERFVPKDASTSLTALTTQEDDGSPGDLTKSALLFDLSPTLGSESLSLSTGVDSTGASSALADLSVDLWNVSLSTPADNPYFEGHTPNAAELIVFDDRVRLNGNAAGIDPQARRATLTLNASYSNGSATGVVDLETSAGRFRADAISWIVARGHRAVVSAEGMIGLFPSSLRLEVSDGGDPGIMVDTFDAHLETVGLGAYDSGEVIADRGNLRVRYV